MEASTIAQGQGRKPGPVAIPPGLGRFVRFVFGTIEYVEMDSRGIQERVRKRYGPQMTELAGLGFEQLCFYGEAFSTARFLFVIPAITVLSMLIERRPLRIHEGTKIMACYPLLVSGDKTTYANPCEMDVKLFTAFTDGTFLVSATGRGIDAAGPTMTKHCGAATIGEAWSSHRLRIREFQSAGKCVDRQISFRRFRDLSQRETELL
jgi:hypothetical protein